MGAVGNLFGALAVARALLPLLLIVALGCDTEASSRKATATVDPPWGVLTDHVMVAAPREQVLGILRRRARKDKPFLPYPGDHGKPRERADELLKKLALAGHGFDLLKPPMDWGAEPKSDRNAHIAQNALRPLRPLVTAHIATGDPRFLLHLKSVLLDWVQYNLVEKRKNPMVWHALSTGQRGSILAYVLEQELRGKPADSHDLVKLVWAARQHCEVLANPRLFNDGSYGFDMMLGLKALVRVLPELKRASEFENYADDKLKQLLSTHFSKEGFHLEHSPEYHVAATRAIERVMETGLFDDVDALKSVVKNARGVAYQLYHPNGDRVLVGDSSRGRMRVGGVAREHYRYLRSEGRRGRRPQAGLLVHPDAGYGVYRSSFDDRPFEQHSFLFFAPGYHSQHHKHADHLTFEWSERGQPILVDSGKYAYERDEWRQFFVSTRAGNAVEVDEMDYSTRSQRPWGGGFSVWGELRSIQYMQTQVEHDGVKVRQTRTLLLAPKKWLCVIDQMSSEQPHIYRQWFQFHEALNVSARGSGFVAEGPHKFKVFVASRALAGKVEARHARGQIRPRTVGWLSADYQQKHKRWSVAFKTRGRSVVIASLFSLSARAQPPTLKRLDTDLLVRLPSGTGGRGVKIRPRHVGLE
jgi:hypothetical protein